MRFIPLLGFVCLTMTTNAQTQTETDPVLILLTSVINSEASGESYEEKLRVGNVVLNRIQSKYYPNNIVDVIYQRKQFSGICSRLFRYDPNGDRGDKESIKAAKALLDGHRVLNKEIIGFFNECYSTNKRFVSRIKDKVVFTSDAHSYFKA